VFRRGFDTAGGFEVNRSTIRDNGESAEPYDLPWLLQNAKFHWNRIVLGDNSELDRTFSGHDPAGDFT